MIILISIAICLTSTISFGFAARKINFMACHSEFFIVQQAWSLGCKVQLHWGIKFHVCLSSLNAKDIKFRQTAVFQSYQSLQCQYVLTGARNNTLMYLQKSSDFILMSSLCFMRGRRITIMLQILHPKTKQCQSDHYLSRWFQNLQISALSPCRLICCQCAMSQGGPPPISSLPHPQIAGYGRVSHCDQQHQHITRLFPRSLFPTATKARSIWACWRKKPNCQ